MKIVVDANMFIAALVKNSKAREVIVSGKLKLITPDFILEEIYKYKKELCRKTGLTSEFFDIFVKLLFQTITIIPQEEYQSKIKKAKTIMKDDPKDVTYVACYLALNCAGIWTNDPHFREKEELKLFSTRDLLELI